MSLQVWLPLNGDLHNQGLSNIEFINASSYFPTINNNGKIGKCYSFNGSTNYLRFLYPMSNLYGQWSFCCWVKPNNITSNMTLLSSRKTTGAGMAIFILSGKIRFDNGTDSGNSQVNFTTSLTANTWQHICVIQTASTRQLYINGILKETISANPTTSNTSQYMLIGASSSSDSTPTNNYLNGYINDVRIYSHALSQKEVEELAKGLVLHYPLNDRFCESTTNLCTSGTLGNSAYNGAINKYGYGTTTDMYKTTGIFQGKQATKVYMGTAGNSAYPYVYFDNIHPLQNQYKTLSFDYYPTSQTTLIFYTYNGSGTTTYSVDNDPAISGTNIPVKLNQWNHIVFTILGTSNETQGWGYVKIGITSHTSTTTDYWLFANIQIEEKDHPTGYVGPGGSHTATTIYDSSGYNNNGIIIGSLKIITPSPRYDCATHLECSSPSTNNNTGLTYIQAPLGLTAPMQMSVCWWGHPESGYGNSSSHAAWCTSASSGDPTDYNSTAFHHRDSKFDICLNSASTTSLGLAFNNYTLHEWHYYCVTYDGKIAILYKDGIETNRSTISNTEAPLKTFTKMFIGFSKAGGVWRKTLGSYSDFRVYTTALTPNQIKELYNTSMTIDNQGNIYARELVE